MKTTTWLAASSVALLLWWSLPVAAQEARVGSAFLPAPVLGGFVGVTTVKVQPGADVVGALNLARACQAQFSGSHVCNSAEILSSGKVPAFPAGFSAAWVNPSLVSIINGPIGLNWNYAMVDASGVVHRSDDLEDGLDCKRWGSNDYTRKGLVIDSDGVFDSVSCGVALPIACCTSPIRAIGR